MKTILLNIAFVFFLNNIGFSQCNLTVDLGPCQVSFIGYGSNCINLTANTTGGTGPFRYQWTPDQGPTATITDCPLAPKTYYVLVTDANGCTATASAQAYVYDVRCGKNLDRTLVCHNGELTCVSEGSLKKHLAHGDKIGPCTDPCIQPIQNFAARMAAITELGYAEEADLNIYPMPAKDIATIEISNAKAELVNLQLISFNGQLVENKKISLANGNNYVELNTKLFKQGSYIIRLIGEKNAQISKKIYLN